MNRKLRKIDLILASIGLVGSLVSMLGADYSTIFNRLSIAIEWAKSAFEYLFSIDLRKYLESLKSLWEILIPHINGWPLIYFEPSMSIIYAGLYVFLIQIIRVELKELIIPDKYTLPGILVGLVLALIFNFHNFLSHLLGAIFLGGIYFILAFIYHSITKREGLGGGVIKMGAMIGAFIGLPNSLLVFLISWFIATIFGLYLSVRKTNKENLKFEFGPFLALASIICTLVPVKFIFGFMVNW